MQKNGSHMLEGLLHRCWCVHPVSIVISAALTGRAKTGHVHRLWISSTKVVVERVLENGRRGLSVKTNAAELLLERLGHDAVGPSGHAGAAVEAVRPLLVPRVHGSPKPRPRE